MEPLKQIPEAPIQSAAKERVDRFEEEFRAKYAKAVAFLCRGQDKLLRLVRADVQGADEEQVERDDHHSSGEGRRWIIPIHNF